MQQQPWLPKKWDKEADVVIVGFGGAGAAAAIVAHDMGARVLMLEKALEGEEGGNTRVAGQRREAAARSAKHPTTTPSAIPAMTAS